MHVCVYPFVCVRTCARARVCGRKRQRQSLPNSSSTCHLFAWFIITLGISRTITTIGIQSIYDTASAWKDWSFLLFYLLKSQVLSLLMNLPQNLDSLFSFFSSLSLSTKLLFLAHQICDAIHWQHCIIWHNYLKREGKWYLSPTLTYSNKKANVQMTHIQVQNWRKCVSYVP